AGGESIVALIGSANGSAGIDCLIPPQADVAGEIGRMVRFAIGQTLRARPRVRCGGRAVLELEAGRAVEAALLDLSGGGVRLDRAQEISAAGPVPLRIELPDGRSIEALATPVRKSSDASSIAFRFARIEPTARASLRAFLIRLACDHEPLSEQL